MEKLFEPLLKVQNELIQQNDIIYDAKKAAVSVIINNLDEMNPTILLIKRNEYDGHHSGQMAFPGGKMDESDGDLLETAIRESLEEIGVDLKNKDFKTLQPVWVKVSNFLLFPYLTFVDKNHEFEINKREINRIFEIPVSFFRNQEFLKAHQIEINGEKFWSPYFEYENETIWGATAIIIYQNIYLKDPFTIN
ncbi:NUDIX hydrolase [Sandaracinomonas limnophila]|nr:CoA pyrophosphatase [Sandaracinomonas limnophila]